MFGPNAISSGLPPSRSAIAACADSLNASVSIEVRKAPPELAVPLSRCAVMPRIASLHACVPPGGVEIGAVPGLVERGKARTDGIDWKLHLRPLEGSAARRKRAAMIRTAVIGYGLGGLAFHAPLVQAVHELELAMVCTSRAALVHERYPQVPVASAEAAIADPSIALVVISTPNDSHFPLAKAALEAGKHVVIDKPFANSVADGEALIALARERGLILSAFHNRRWDGDFLTVRKLIASGRLGEVTVAELRWDR